MSNGYPDQNNSPNSSQLSGEHSDHGGPTLISRTQKQHTTQQVTYRYRRYMPLLLYFNVPILLTLRGKQAPDFLLRAEFTCWQKQFCSGNRELNVMNHFLWGPSKIRLEGDKWARQKHDFINHSLSNLIQIPSFLTLLKQKSKGFNNDVSTYFFQF